MIDILLVEDDKEICFILTELLKRNHYNVSAYHNGIEAIEALSSKKYDLMLLDLMLPDLPGEKILFHLKKHNNSIPVIVISAKNQPEIRINLLRSGADDYITKPFYHEEVLARIESVLRRCSESPQTEYSFKDIRINVDDHKVLVNNTELTLTTTEYNLLQLLIKHPKQTFTKESLYQLIWGKDYISDDNTLNVHISKLRKKLENTSLEEQLEYVEQEICTKESDLKELRHKAKEIQKEIEEKQKDELFKALVASGKTIDEVMRFIKATGEDKIE